MTNHNKLLLLSIGAVGMIGVVGSRVAASLGSPAEMATLGSDYSAPAPGSEREYGELFFEQSYEGVRELEVEMADADVVLETGGAREVVVRFYIDAKDDGEWARELFERMEFEADMSGDMLWVEADDAGLSGREWREHSGFNATAVIYVPSDLDIEVRTSDGDVLGGDFEGRLSISSSDGDIVISSARGSLLDIDTSDGDILVRELRADRASIRSSDGDITLDDVATELSVSTSDGDLQITFAEARDADISTGDGDVLLIAPRTLAATFRLEGEDLNISAGLELRGRLRDDLVEGTLNGGGPRIDVRTGDGEVTLRSGA